MYSLLYDTPYDRMIVRRLNGFRALQEKKNVLVNNTEPDILVHHKSNPHKPKESGKKNCKGKCNKV